jgi:hypothetical protein
MSCSFSASSLQNCNFYKEVVQKLKFPNNSIVKGDKEHETNKKTVLRNRYDNSGDGISSGVR